MTEPQSSNDDAVGFLVSNTGALPVSGFGECPDPERISSVDGGGLAGEEHDALVEHAAACENCRALLAALFDEPALDRTVADDGLDGSLDASGMSPGGLDATLGGMGLALDRTVDAPRESQGAPREPGLPERFGPYRIEGHLGAGGMGVVYRALHDVRQRPEALKVVKKGLGYDPHFVERFHREVRSMASLTHEHVVPVYDSGETDGDLYYTMPLLPGPALDIVIAEVRETGESPPATLANAVLDRHEFPDARRDGDAESVRFARRVAAAMAPVADALHEMHSKKMLHRDIKPGNLILGGGGRILLADFGLVRTEDRTITGAGQMLGTPAYMSPEQVLAEGQPVDGRSDIYSLGASVYEMLTGRIPHRGDSVAETLAKILKERVAPVREFNPGVPREIETIVGRCLEKKVVDRYSEASALRDDLSAFSRGNAVKAQPVSGATRFKYWVQDRWIGLAAALVLPVSFLGWQLMRPAEFTIVPAPDAQLFIDGEDHGRTPLLRLSVPPGERIVELRREGFRTFKGTFHAERREETLLNPTLQVLDPNDAVKLSELASAFGMQLTTFVYREDRSDADEPPLAPHFPRGDLLSPPERISLWVADVAEGYRARLLAPDGTEVIAWDVDAPRLDEYVGKDVADLDHTWVTGATYTVSVEKDGEAPRLCSFTVRDAGTSKAVLARLDEISERFAPEDPAQAVLKFEVLFQEGLFNDAYNLAIDAREGLGLGVQVTRMALVALKGAGLEGRGNWRVLADLHLEASEEPK